MLFIDKTKRMIKKMGCGSLIKNRDDFGQPVELNFDRKGSVYQTKIGGLLSIIIKLLLLVYIYMKISKMIDNSLDNKDS